MKKLIVRAIEWYQRWLSPDTGAAKDIYISAGCRFVPSCSQYMKEAVEKKGVVVGLLKGMWRILRCNPFSKGGVDRV